MERINEEHRELWVKFAIAASNNCNNTFTEHEWTTGQAGDHIDQQSDVAAKFADNMLEYYKERFGKEKHNA